VRRCALLAFFAILPMISFISPPVCLAEGPALEGAGPMPKIEGSERFVQRTQWAMRWIEKAGWAPYVAQNLALIKEDPASPFLGAMGLTPDGRAAAVFRSAPDDLWWFASAIVHEAAHAADMAAGRKFWGVEGEHAADLEQQRFLDALGSPTRVVRDPTSIADSPRPSIAMLQALVEGRLRVALPDTAGADGVPATDVGNDRVQAR